MSYLAKNYNRKKISFKFGKGSYLYSTDNKKYCYMWRDGGQFSTEKYSLNNNLEKK